MENIVISDMEKDALGEIMNISMGSAATAASELLNAKVWITTPMVEVDKLSNIHAEKLEPAVCVKIEYIKGISGSNLMVWRQDDLQLVLNQLMGMPLVVTPDFEFDELNISAVSEVMNQMMGSSATALSDFLGVSVDISTPTPYIMDKISLAELQDFDPEETVCAINFNLTIDGVIQSEFKSVMSMELAKEIAGKVLGEAVSPEPASEPVPQPEPVAPPPMSQAQAVPQQMQAAPQMPMQPQMPAQQPMMQPQMPQQQPMMQQPMPQQMPMQMPMADPSAAYGYPPYGGYGYPPYGYPPPQPMNIQNAQLHSFEPADHSLSGSQKDNLQLLMDVPLQISVELGSARRKVKDILEFTQGTIIELERQAGAPVDIIVNGNLIAKGDVVVIDDNFAVRITEIIKSKLIDTLSKE